MLVDPLLDAFGGALRATAVFAGMGYVDGLVTIRTVVGSRAVLGFATVHDGFGCLDVFERLFVTFLVVVKMLCE